MSGDVRYSHKHITAERLRFLLAYDPDTGIFRWLHTSCRRLKAGDIAGCAIAGRCTRIRVDGKECKAHRLAWLYMTGDWPEFEIDHRDGDPSNNRWLNLRPATHAQNLCNTKLRADNQSGAKGVKLDKRNGRWRARIFVNDRYVSLGGYDTKDEASAAYAMAARQHFGEFART